MTNKLQYPIFEITNRKGFFLVLVIDFLKIGIYLLFVFCYLVLSQHWI